MMMFGLYAMRDRPPTAQPFDVVALHGMVRDQYGKKMSKSFGNVVDPLDWIDRFGADATRFTLARGANPGADVPVSEEWCQGSRNFCNKLWNATRFALLNGATVEGELPAPDRLSTVDRWILSRLQHVIAEVDEQFEEFEFAKVCDSLYHFAWDDVCDWYVELAKPVLAGGGAGRRRHPAGARPRAGPAAPPAPPGHPVRDRRALDRVDGTRRRSVVVAPWPTTASDPMWTTRPRRRSGRLQRVVTEVRRFRSDQGLRPGQRVAARTHRA